MTEQTTEDPRRIEWVPLDDLQPDPENPKDHDEDAISSSVDRFGMIDIIARDDRTGRIVSGHGRVKVLRRTRDNGGPPPDGVRVDPDGTWLAPVITGWASADDLAAQGALIALNQTTILGGWVDDQLLTLLDRLREAGQVEVTGFDEAEIAALRARVETPEQPEPMGPGPSLADRFLVPPFTVLDARGGDWQTRKRRWLDLGIQSEVGRGGTAAEGISGRGPDQYRQLNGTRSLGAVQTNLDGVDAARYGRARTIKGQESLTAIKPNLAGALAGDRTLAQGLQAHRDSVTGELVYTETTAAGVSIFDPVLCELAYRWFSPLGGHVLDPFAGGSVRGIVAAALSRSYTGVELRPEQVAANEAQRTILDRLADPPPVRWVPGDSRVVIPELDDAPADLVFSCPPYADLEVYSDDPADLSNMPYDDFLTAYRQIITAACARLRDDRYAVWVIGEVRDKRGLYRGLVPDTIRAFVDAGLALYNEAILVTPVGSLPIRAGKQFAAGRKLGKTHQNVLVFCKGDPRAAADACGTVEVTMPEGLEGDA